jgi:hyperosmotically inducible periplasmic protein
VPRGAPIAGAADRVRKIIVFETRNRGRAMKKFVLMGVIAASTACLPLAFASDDSTDHHYVKDSMITTKVKAKLAAKHMSTLTRVKVDTDENGVVWLSGTAPTKDARDLAGMIAKDTDGVRDVNNNIDIAPK